MKYDTCDRNIQRILSDLYTVRTKNRTFLARTRNGRDIYINHETVKQMKSHPELNRKNIIQAIEKIDDYDGKFYIKSIDIGKVVGKDDCVKRTSCDNTRLLYKKGCSYPFPICTNSQLQDTSMVTVILSENMDGVSEFLSAFYGIFTPKHPWDTRLSDDERNRSEDFWRNYTLIVNKDDIDWNKSTPVKLFDGNRADILSMSGFNDGFYWECLAKFLVNEDTFYMYNCGTNTYRCTHQEITRKEKRLKQSFQLMRIRDHGYDFTNIFPDCVNEKTFIQEMYQKFVESGADEFFSYSAGTYFTEIWIDDIPNRIENVSPIKKRILA